MSVVQIIIDCGNGAALRIQSSVGTRDSYYYCQGFYFLLVCLPFGVCKYFACCKDLKSVWGFKCRILTSMLRRRRWCTRSGRNNNNNTNVATKQYSVQSKLCLLKCLSLSGFETLSIYISVFSFSLAKFHHSSTKKLGVFWKNLCLRMLRRALPQMFKSWLDWKNGCKTWTHLPILNPKP